MGIILSKHNNETRRRYKESKLIDHELQLEKQRNFSTIKLLLLGPAECGKSTVLKQLKIIHSSGFNDVEISTYRSIINSNIVSSMIKIINAMQKFNINFGELEREADADKVIGAEKISAANDFAFTFDLVAALKKLWQDVGVQKCFLRGSEYQLNDSTKYFFDDLDRICANDYVPNQHDVLRSRQATTGIVEISITVKNFLMKIFDVGGQRSERRKWIHCFDNVNAVIFIVALSEYNAVLAEDEKTNRTHESLMLFETICNSQVFAKASMVLYLNKTDLFAEKILLYPLTIAFPEYTGNQTYDECLKYMESKFVHVKKDAKKVVYVHPTCATDTKSIQFVTSACFDIIFNENMKRAGFQ